MIYSFIFICLFVLGIYFTYIKPKQTMLNDFKKDPQFANYILIIESNQEFDRKNYKKSMRHLKLFLIHYSDSQNQLNNLSDIVEKLEHHKVNINKYLNRMLFSIPNSMRRYNYMTFAIQNLDIYLKQRIEQLQI